MITRIATKLLMITGLRTIELRTSEWSDIDFEKGIWQIPAERMKMRRPHIVPLSMQARELLEEIYQIIERGRADMSFMYGMMLASPYKPISEASINQMIKLIGYNGRATDRRKVMKANQ